MAQRLFSSSDLDRISHAVKAAEGRTSGEIVPYVVDQSDAYEEAVWRGGGFFAILALVALVIFHMTTDTWHGLGPAEIAIIAIGAMGLGIVLTRRSWALKRLLAGNELMEHRVAQRAAQAFIAEEVFRTKDRTGILLFLSLGERKVLAVGDSGINAKVAHSEWEDVVASVTKGIGEGRAADGFIEAISKCGRLLQERGVKRRRGDRNELSNKLRMGNKKKAGRKRS
jgi:putative membrane protein